MLADSIKSDFIVDRTNKQVRTDASGEDGSTIDVVALGGHAVYAGTQGYRKTRTARHPVPAYRCLAEVCKKTRFAMAPADVTYSQRELHRLLRRVSTTKQLPLLAHPSLNHV